MDASQYKDYLLVLLFVKYVSDRYLAATWGARCWLLGNRGISSDVEDDRVRHASKTSRFLDATH
jgi:hypothetical protein